GRDGRCRDRGEFGQRWPLGDSDHAIAVPVLVFRVGEALPPRLRFDRHRFAPRLSGVVALPRRTLTAPPRRNWGGSLVSVDYSLTISAVTMPNMPCSDSACDRTWQWKAQTPASVASTITSQRSPGATVSVSHSQGCGWR